MDYDIVNNVFDCPMNLSSADWSCAQNLLLKLVQVLSPMAVEEGPAFYYVDSKFFFKPNFSDTSLKQPVQWLQTLQTVQKEVDRFIGKALPVNVAEDPAPIEELLPQRQEVLRSGDGRSRWLRNLSQIAPANPALKGWTSAVELPVQHQAKRLILEVQHAIGRLSQSTNLKEPKLEPLQEALLQLKSPLESLVQSVSKEEAFTPSVQEERGGEGAVELISDSFAPNGVDFMDPNPSILPFTSPAKIQSSKEKKKKKKKRNPFKNR